MPFQLPDSEGYLPYWFLLTSFLGVFNAVQCYSSLSLAKRLYGKSPALVNPLTNRLNAAWTFTAALVRFYAAYNVNNKVVYDLAIGTYVIAFFHFSTELFAYKTLQLIPGGINPVVVASTSLVWMWKQYDFYVKA